MTRPRMTAIFAIVLCLALSHAAIAEDPPATAGDGNSDLAQELTNPLANLVTIPIQMNYDRNIGPRDDGSKLQTNVQPVVPFRISDDWNLITRTIVPVTYQKDLFPGAGSQFGLGDVNVSLFFSPARPSSGLIWGVGPVFLLPTATDTLLGAEKWGAGPAGVILTMRGPWTLGVLGNHVWSFAGDGDRSDIRSTFVQPFAAYTWPNAWTVSMQSESTRDWERDQWSIPVNVAVSKLVRFGRLPVSVQGGVGRWLESPEAGADGWRFRVQVNLVLPRSR